MYSFRCRWRRSGRFVRLVGGCCPQEGALRNEEGSVDGEERSRLGQWRLPVTAGGGSKESRLTANGLNGSEVGLNVGGVPWRY